MGISNEMAAAGYSQPYQGATMTSLSMVPVPVGSLDSDITITPESGVPITITGDPQLTDSPGIYQDNYAAKVAALFSGPGTGLAATANAATVDLGPAVATDPFLTGYVDGVDTYTLNITSGGNPVVSVTLDGLTPPGLYDFTLDGMVSAFEATGATVNTPGESGVLSNGVSYDISTGALVLTGPADGSEIELTETIVGTPSGILPGGTQTVYGTVNIATNSTTNVDIAGATTTSTGLASIGLTAGTLDGASKMDLFTVLTRTEEAIRAGNVNDINGEGGSIQSQLRNLDIAAEQNRSLRSQLGARASRIDTAILHQEDAKIDLQQILSRYQDADIIEVYNDIMQKENAFKAALNITSRISQISILDYF
jgi:flagellar hook-associated protein 3 FlgL